MARSDSSNTSGRRSKLMRKVVGICRRFMDLDKRSKDHTESTTAAGNGAAQMAQTASHDGDQLPKTDQASDINHSVVQVHASGLSPVANVHMSVQTEMTDPDPHLLPGPEYQLSASRSSLCDRIVDLKFALTLRKADIRRLRSYAQERERTITRLIGNGEPAESRVCELCGRDGAVPETQIAVRPWESEEAREWSRRTGDMYFFTGSDCDRGRVGPSVDEDVDEYDDEVDEEDGWVWSELEWWKPFVIDEFSDSGDGLENIEDPADTVWPQVSYGEANKGEL